MSLQGHTAQREHKVSMGSRVQWFNGSVVQMRCTEVSLCEFEVEMVPARRGEKGYEAEDLGDRKMGKAAM